MNIGITLSTLHELPAALRMDQLAQSNAESTAKLSNSLVVAISLELYINTFTCPQIVELFLIKI
jgi:hypothetical protein